MKPISHFLLISSLLLLPGCGGVVKMINNTFPQVQKYKEKTKEIMPYLQHLYVYDQFNTVALFDALWLCDQVRTLYTDVYTTMMGKNQKESSLFLRRQLQANEHFITFYVLSTLSVPLSVKPIPWALHLEVDGITHMPEHVKAIDITEPYRMFFGAAFDAHKQAYDVKFNRVLADGKIVLEENKSHVVSLVFSNAVYYSKMTWHIDASGTIIKKEIEQKKAPSEKNKHKKRERL